MTTALEKNKRERRYGVLGWQGEGFNFSSLARVGTMEETVREDMKEASESRAYLQD